MSKAKRPTRTKHVVTPKQKLLLELPEPTKEEHDLAVARYNEFNNTPRAAMLRYIGNFNGLISYLDKKIKERKDKEDETETKKN